MPEYNLAGVRERHLAAVRWEKCRACWFERNGHHDQAKACKQLMKEHLRAASDAAMGLKKNQKPR